jgi:hypothetical protein
MLLSGEIEVACSCEISLSVHGTTRCHEPNATAITIIAVRSSEFGNMVFFLMGGGGLPLRLQFAHSTALTSINIKVQLKYLTFTAKE